MRDYTFHHQVLAETFVQPGGLPIAKSISVLQVISGMVCLQENTIRIEDCKGSGHTMAFG